MGDITTARSSITSGVRVERAEDQRLAVIGDFSNTTDASGRQLEGVGAPTRVFREEQLKGSVIIGRLKNGTADLAVSFSGCRRGFAFKAKIFLEGKLVGGFDPFRIKMRPVFISSAMLACRAQKRTGECKPGRAKSQAP